MIEGDKGRWVLDRIEITDVKFVYVYFGIIHFLEHELDREVIEVRLCMN